jgi:pimeloyl-ACP methyl ester carboxylesterase
MNRLNSSFCLFIACCLACLALLGIAGCSYLNIPSADDVLAKPERKQGGISAPVYNSAVIKGKLSGGRHNGTSTLVAAYRISTGDPEISGYAMIDGGPSFMFYLPEGRYHLCAFTDDNGNGIYEENEISGCFGTDEKPADIPVHEGALITDIVIKISKPRRQALKYPLPSSLKPPHPMIRQVTQNGQIQKIYSEYFSLENAQTGYWNPSSFMKSFGAHIYLTEPYHPKKIPILFIHGTEGSPYNWIYLYMRLDLNRYQPWFFYYPSGIRIPLAAALLNEELGELHKRYGFQKMVITAHSVGGLTARYFLNTYVSEKRNPFVKLLVTFATPWSGFGLADASQTLTHKSIPVWVDLGSQSDFIKNTLSHKMPATVRHYNFYGKNDTLAGRKAVDERVLAYATKSYGFDCTHDSILSDRKVFAQFNAILEKELW